MEVSKHTFWVEIPQIKIRMHESLNQTQSPFYWIPSLCTGVGQVFKNKSTHQLKNTLKMSKENVKLLLVKSSGKNFWQWSLLKIISHSCKHLNCFTGSSVVVQTLETKHNKITHCQYGHNSASKYCLGFIRQRFLFIQMKS